MAQFKAVYNRIINIRLKKVIMATLTAHLRPDRESGRPDERIKRPTVNTHGLRRAILGEKSNIELIIAFVSPPHGRSGLHAVSPCIVG